MPNPGGKADIKIGEAATGGDGPGDGDAGDGTGGGQDKPRLAEYPGTEFEESRHKASDLARVFDNEGH
jgi:hypothetical protein